MKALVLKAFLALIALVIIGGMLGVTAVVILAVAALCYKDFKHAAQNYEAYVITKDISKVTGNYYSDAGILQDALSRPLYRGYLLFGVIPIVFYGLFLLFLFKINPDAYAALVISDERFLDLLDKFLPTISSHYHYLAEQGEDKAPLTRQLYSLIFLWASFSAVIYVPLLRPYIRLCIHILGRQKTIVDAYIKPVLLIALLLSLISLYYYFIFDAPQMGGSKDYIFGQYGHYNILSNNHFFLYMAPGLMIPPLIVLALIFSVSLFKILSAKEHSNV